MRKFRTVYMRGGTSKGCLFHREDLPEDRAEWDDIFLQVMGCPDPKQIDGMGGTVSSSNKIVVIWKSEEPDVDIEYLVGQVIVGKRQVDYKSNCGNMTAAVPAYAVEEGMVPVTEPVTRVRMLNKNTDKYINVDVPIDPETHTFAQDGDCEIAGVDGTAARLLVNFLSPAGSRTGKLFPTGHLRDTLDIPGFGKIESTIIDVSNPIVLVRAADIHMKADELPEEVNGNQEVMDLLEKIRGAACVKMGFATDLKDATDHSPAVPKVGFAAKPLSYKDLEGHTVNAEQMDLAARVISVFKCHKACPLTAANSISTAAMLDGTIVSELVSADHDPKSIRIGHPSGVMTLIPDIGNKENGIGADVRGVAVERTARRIMDGTVYIRN